MSVSIRNNETVSKTENISKNEFDIDTKLSLLMKSLTDFYRNSIYIE